MKTNVMVATATLGVWLASSASVQAGAFEKSIELIAPTATQYVKLTGPSADRRAPLATQYAELTGQEPFQMVLQIGTGTENFVLIPKTLRFENGKLYKFMIVNLSKIAHFVFAPEFGAAIDSISLTQGVALKPGDQQVWYFVLDQAGTYGISSYGTSSYGIWHYVRPQGSRGSGDGG
jgi:hypothetical protein